MSTIGLDSLYYAPITEDEKGEETEQNTQNEEKNYKYLSLYDSVIVEGKELFDGKRVK